MEWQTIVGAISTVGFPIIACIMVYKAMMDNNKDFNSQVRDMMKLHSDEIKSLQKTVDDNTAVISRLIDRIDMINSREKGD